MQETVLPNPTEEFTQGDIIQIDEEHSSENYSFGVIINADCDLAHDKIDGVIAYLPMYNFFNYFFIFWAPNYIKENKNNLLHQVENICDCSEYDHDFLIDWLQKEGSKYVSEKISGYCKINGRKKEKLYAILDKLYFMTENDVDIVTKFQNICNLEKNPETYAKNIVKQSHSNMGDGHLFISELTGSDDVGYVIRMRRIYSIDVSKCYTTESAHRSSTQDIGPTAVRIARLAPPFRFKLAQLFAQQYSRIGLPDEITALSALAIDDLTSKLVGKPT